ncbi:MAG: 16S rRNA (guanine(966)-N(2))-methyltransferase RsmD [Bacilli bacterium]|nr:16S rRNA (guanine(966)-N(2))-methyltransferase RsmD [Bacilli bacterium]MDD3304635.1 16S rRNA (guanine(966)-N(2))-methyltransferase RsmD [Bacilli bacterium]MDD4053548.1 16S rRNA (guanine(966)-N(2))-methyltransferase RsmD [Bacilli bacterium]MDD4411485.1 16S rRNA (guanine(966)-N(2))-methyltransferase RsmD [Bacilli bacterium]
MRVISGSLRSRAIKGDNIKGTRPTMDKIKESLFAMIQDEVRDSICLDLFAGSGSLGIEAISNEAKLVYFVDKNKECIEVVDDNIRTFEIGKQAKVLFYDYRKALTYFKNNNIQFDLIFLDPPYSENLIEEIISFINKNNLLVSKGKVICEYTTEQLKDSYDNLTTIKDRSYGDKKIKIYVNNK